MRDNKWLKKQLAKIWRNNFSDVKVANIVVVKFGRKAKTRLGSIKCDNASCAKTYITVSGYLKDEKIPDYIVETVLAHELVHYAHGFFSPHPQLYAHPHQHKIVDLELTKRGLGDILKSQKKWLKKNWRSIIKNSD